MKNKNRIEMSEMIFDDIRDVIRKYLEAIDSSSEEISFQEQLKGVAEGSICALGTLLSTIISISLDVKKSMMGDDFNYRYEFERELAFQLMMVSHILTDQMTQGAQENELMDMLEELPPKGSA